MDFIRNNALLIGLAIGSGLMLLLPMFKRSAGGVPNLNPNEAVTLINRSHALVLDVRDESEFATGHIAEAMHIPVANLEARLNELKKYKDKAILVNCQRGLRGGQACEILRKAEFSQVHNLKGGLNAWVEAKLPIVTGAAVKNDSPVKMAKSTSVKSSAAKAPPKKVAKTVASEPDAEPKVVAVAANDPIVQDTEKS